MFSTQRVAAKDKPQVFAMSTFTELKCKYTSKVKYYNSHPSVHTITHPMKLLAHIFIVWLSSESQIKYTLQNNLDAITQCSKNGKNSAMKNVGMSSDC